MAQDQPKGAAASATPSGASGACLVARIQSPAADAERFLFRGNGKQPQRSKAYSSRYSSVARNSELGMRPVFDQVTHLRRDPVRSWPRIRPDASGYPEPSRRRGPRCRRPQSLASGTAPAWWNVAARVPAPIPLTGIPPRGDRPRVLRGARATRVAPPPDQALSRVGMHARGPRRADGPRWAAEWPGAGCSFKPAWLGRHGRGGRQSGRARRVRASRSNWIV